MCIIAIKPKGMKMFDKKTIDTMFINNPDGSGYMYYDSKSKKVVIKKGFMTSKALMKSLNEKDLTKTNVILHFRIGTSGYFDKMNCHPYPIYDTNKLECKTDIAMAHNGILQGYIPPKISDINDTQVFIQNVLRNLKKGFQYDTDKLMLIEELIGTNKFAFLDSKNQITLIGNFIEDGGYIYSNTSYKPKYAYQNSVVVTKDTKIDDYDFWKDYDDENSFWREWDLAH